VQFLLSFKKSRKDAGPLSRRIAIARSEQRKSDRRDRKISDDARTPQRLKLLISETLPSR
jgi:hypothetical protein